MENNNFKIDLDKAISDEIIDIANKLIQYSNKDKNGIFWKTQGRNNDIIIEQINENLYNGNSGILIFFLELYGITKKNEYLSIVLQSLNWIEKYCQRNPKTNYSLYVGRMSLVLVYLRMFSIFNDEKYIRRAIYISKKSLNFIQYPQNIELLSGISGTLLCLLKLYKEVNDKWIKEYIDIGVDVITSNYYVGEKGIFWDRADYNLRGLCGLSHGTSGVSYALMEIVEYFQNYSLTPFIEESIKYENSYYINEEKNWSDFRKPLYITENEIYNKRHVFYNNSFIKRKNEKNINAWCHGSAGIILNRFMAYKLFKNIKYLKQVKDNLDPVINYRILDQKKNELFILCHGRCGNSEILFQLYNYYGDLNYLNKAKSIGLKAIEQKSQLKKYLNGMEYYGAKEDPGLMIGVAGIGHYLLRLLNPTKVSSVLFPSVNAVTRDADNYKKVRFDLEVTYRKLIDKSFPKTSNILRYFNKIMYDDILSKIVVANPKDIKKYFYSKVNNRMKDLALLEKRVLRDVLKFEWETNKVYLSIRNDYLFNKMINREFDSSKKRLKKLKIHATVKVSPFLKVISCKWDWTKNDYFDLLKENIQEEEHANILLKPNLESVYAMKLDNLSYLILKNIYPNESIEKLIDRISKVLDIDSSKYLKESQKVILKQIHELIFSKLIIVN
ncbi:MAG: hypothetical protein IT280_00025 [Ignavibacteria bacterium]|nr:hypothetical protein [Ignavibacteria bacterium]